MSDDFCITDVDFVLNIPYLHAQFIFIFLTCFKNP